MTNMVPLFKVFMPENIEHELGIILNSGKLAYGQYTKKFEEKLQDFVGNTNILTISGNSVFFALKLIEIEKEDEIIASPMACLATNQPVTYSGAKIIWADIDPLTASLDPEDVKKKITPKTKAIIHYHWSGYPGYIDEINQIAKEKGIYVIEDASEAFGAEYKGNILGNTNSDIVCYSFTPVRLPNAIDGGGLAINDKSLFNKAHLMRDYGIERSCFRDRLGEISSECDIAIPSDGCLMNNVSGFIGSCQVDHISRLYFKQRENARNLSMRFRDINNVNLIGQRDDINPSFWTYTILTSDRDDLLESFRKEGLYASKLHLRNDLYSVFKSSGDKLLGVNEFHNKQLNLPCGWWVNKDDYDRYFKI